MKSRTPISLFPFLSVLLSTMGVLAFLTVMFPLLSRNDILPPQSEEPVEISWVGAPAHVRPLLVECRKDSVVSHLKLGQVTNRTSFADLEREVEIVRGLLASGRQQVGPRGSRYQLWVYMKSAIQNEPRLNGSFTRMMHDVELDNLSGQSRRALQQRYPILLVYSAGVETYELASYLVESTTQLAIGLEPMLKGWALPYPDHAS